MGQQLKRRPFCSPLERAWDMKLQLYRPCQTTLQHSERFGIYLHAPLRPPLPLRPPAASALYYIHSNLLQNFHSSLPIHLFPSSLLHTFLCLACLPFKTRREEENRAELSMSKTHFLKISLYSHSCSGQHLPSPQQEHERQLRRGEILNHIRCFSKRLQSERSCHILSNFFTADVRHAS